MPEGYISTLEGSMLEELSADSGERLLDFNPSSVS